MDANTKRIQCYFLVYTLTKWCCSCECEKNDFPYLCSHCATHDDDGWVIQPHPLKTSTVLLLLGSLTLLLSLKLIMTSHTHIYIFIFLLGCLCMFSFFYFPFLQYMVQCLPLALPFFFADHTTTTLPQLICLNKFTSYAPFYGFQQANNCVSGSKPKKRRQKVVFVFFFAKSD